MSKQYINNFRRDEKKYLLTEDEQARLLAKIGDKLREDEYFQETICSLYFDTPEHDLIIKSIDKPVYKQKVRLRSYGVPTLDDEVFLEIKVKFRGVVTKRRTKVKLREFYKFYQRLESGKKTKLKADYVQVGRELVYLFDFYKLCPSWIVIYDRECYCGKGNPNLRITFDKNLRSRTEVLRLEAGDDGEPYFAEKMYIMEIKALDAMPIWLVTALSELKIYPVSFTKYGNIYKKYKKGLQHVN